MKKSLFILILCSSLWTVGVAQSPNFPLDERNKINFWEVVKTDSVASAKLYINAKRWLKESGYQIVSDDSLAGKIVAKQSLGVYDKGYVSKKLHGKVAYQLSIDLKDSKYRYQFTDFVFHYYQEDRNYQFAPSGKEKDLEEKIAKGWQGLWENHQKNTFNTIQKQIELLKKAMRWQAQPIEPEVNKPRTEDW
ncbi:MAG: DUF4468 domain-containing protein [Microscillaceae bacterium]|nr:DUF4468 domain-containing protein [Microscillaceae bacterium]